MRILLSLFLIFIMYNTNYAQGIAFFEGTWEEALELAQTEERIIFVDAYAQWCGPCKRMAATTFKDDSVGAFFNANFINMKLDMERGEGLTFRQKYPVSAFPTLYFIDGKGEVVHKVKGAQDVERILKLGKFALSKVDYSADYAKRYEEGDRDPQLIYDYVRALNKSNKPSLKIANDYLYEQEDLTTDFNQKFILEATTEADSRIFDLLIEHRTNIERLTSPQAVKDAIAKACDATVQKAIEFESSDLLERAKTKMSKHHPDGAKDFALMADMSFYQKTGDIKNYIKCCKKYVKKEETPSKLYDTAVQIRNQYATNAQAMKMAEKFAKKAAENNKDEFKYMFTYALILADNGKHKDALATAKKSLKMAEGNKRAQMDIQQFIEKLQKS